jgi:tetratricopeptide (TPR) repeat protein
MQNAARQGFKAGGDRLRLVLVGLVAVTLGLAGIPRIFGDWYRNVANRESAHLLARQGGVDYSGLLGDPQARPDPPPALGSASALLDRAARWGAGDAGLAIDMARLSLWAGRPEQAAPLFTQGMGVTTGARRDVALLLSGIAAYQSRQEDQALLQWREARGSVARFLCGLGRRSLESSPSDPELAVRLYSLASAVDPALSEAHFGLGLAYQELEQWEAAFGAYQRAVDSDLAASQSRVQAGDRYSLAAAYAQMGAVHLARGQAAAAAGAYQLALQVEPAGVRARLGLGRARLVLGDLPQAALHLRLAVVLDPSEPQAHHWLGRALLETGVVDQAVVHLEWAAALDPASVWYHLRLAEAYESLERWQEAIDQYRLALECSPDNAYARSRLDALLGEHGQTSP